MEHASPVVRQDQKTKQDLASEGRDREEVDRDQIAEVIGEDRAPGL
jgi:hypothetical protein